MNILSFACGMGLGYVVGKYNLIDTTSDMFTIETSKDGKETTYKIFGKRLGTFRSP